MVWFNRNLNVTKNPKYVLNIFHDVREFFEISVFHISRVDCIELMSKFKPQALTYT